MLGYGVSLLCRQLIGLQPLGVAFLAGMMILGFRASVDEV